MDTRELEQYFEPKITRKIRPTPHTELPEERLRQLTLRESSGTFQYEEIESMARELLYLRTQLAEARKNALEEAAKAVPTTWLDQIFAEKDMAGEVSCRTMERMCFHIAARIRALASTTDGGK